MSEEGSGNVYDYEALRRAAEQGLYGIDPALEAERRTEAINRVIAALNRCAESRKMRRFDVVFALSQPLPKMMTTKAKIEYLRAIRPSSEILTAAVNGNAQAREIVRLATDRTPDSGGQRRRLNGTVGVFVSPSPADTPREGRDEREG